MAINKLDRVKHDRRRRYNLVVDANRDIQSYFTMYDQGLITDNSYIRRTEERLHTLMNDLNEVD